MLDTVGNKYSLPGWEMLYWFLQRFVMKEVKTIKMLKPLIGQYRWFIGGIVGLGLLGTIFESVGISLFIPLLYSFNQTYFEFASDSWLVVALNKMVDVLPASNRIYIISSAILVLILLKNVVIYTQEVLSSQLYANVGYQLRGSIFEQLLDVSISFIDRNETGKFINTLAGETWTTAEAVSNFVEFIIVSFAIFMLTVLLFLVSWQLTLFVIAVSIFISISVRLLTRPIENLSHQGVSTEEAMSQHTIEVLNGMRIVRLCGREQYEKTRFAHTSQAIKQIYFKLDRLSSLIHPVSEILATVSIIGVLIALSQNPNQLPLILTFIIILYRLQPLVIGWDETRTAILEAAAPVEVVMDLTKVEDKPCLSSGSIPFTQLQQAIEFKNVSFNYDRAEPNTVENISIRFPKNKTTAIVGPSGAGKSTLIHLISRFYDPTNGVIYIDDVPLQELNLASWRQRIAVVSQDIHLFNITIRQNIAYGKMEATEAQIVEAAEKAGIHQFISALPEGYETKVGDQGVRLSGGQKQRIALARAIIRDPDILILDEATNALDSISETQIQKTIQKFRQNRTVIIIAHRLSTIEDADQIFVISAGQIIEHGSMPELLQKDKLFAKLHSLQNSNVSVTKLKNPIEFDMKAG